MKLTKTERLILFSLGQFYKQLNQPLTAKPITVRTSKIAFITFILHSEIITKRQRALYKNLEDLEVKKLISYEKRMIRFTVQGLKILEKINQEIEQFIMLKVFFRRQKGKKDLQTIIGD